MSTTPAKPKIIEDYAEKILGGGLCILPVILMIVLATLLITNSHTDLCHADNYTCNTPIIIDEKPAEQPQKPAEQPAIVQPSNSANSSTPQFISDIDKAKADLERARSQSNSAFIDTNEHFDPLEIKNKYNCNDAILVGGPKKASNSTSKTYQIIGIVLLVILILITMWVMFNKSYGVLDQKILYITKFFSPNSIGIHDRSAIWYLYSLIITALISLILSIFYLVTEKNVKGNYLVFSINLICILVGIVCLLNLYAAATSNIANVIKIILMVISIIIIIGTSILNTTETDNLNKGFLNTAINNTTMKIIPFLIGIVALGNLLSIGYGIKTHQHGKAAITFMVTQGISVILLIAFIAFYYDYKSKCSSHSIATCKPVPKYTYDDEGNLVTTLICEPKTYMPVSKTAVTNTSIAMIVLMAITQIVGLGAVIIS